MENEQKAKAGQEAYPVQPEATLTPDEQADLDDAKSILTGLQERAESEHSERMGKLNEAKKQIVIQILKAVKAAGYDPRDPGAVREYVNELQENDPDAAKIFEFVLEALED
jgi:hypothetical protein